MPLPRLQPGDLRRRITIRRASEVQNEKGGYDESWASVATVWAEVQGMTGRESVMESVLQGVSVYRLRIRFRGDVRQSDQILFGSEALNIRSVTDPNGDREQLVIVADTSSVRKDG